MYRGASHRLRVADIEDDVIIMGALPMLRVHVWQRDSHPDPYKIPVRRRILRLKLTGNHELHRVCRSSAPVQWLVDDRLQHGGSRLSSYNVSNQCYPDQVQS